MRISNCLLPALALATLIASSGSMAAELKVPDAGAKELQFGIGSSFTLHQIDQYMISYQQYLSNKLAWRADFGLDLSSTDGDSKSLYFNSEGEPAIPSDAEYDQSSFGVHLCAQILMYPVQKRISPFLGAGLEWAYSSSTQDEVENSIQDYSRDSSYMRVAGVGSVGVRWLLMEQVELVVETGLHIGYSNQEGESTQYHYDDARDEYESDVSSFFCEAKDFRFALAFWF